MRDLSCLRYMLMMVKGLIKNKTGSHPPYSVPWVATGANDGQCLKLVSFSASNLEYSCSDSAGQDASP